MSSKSPHDHGIHGHPEERDPPAGSPALVLSLGTVVFLLIVYFLIGIERGWRESVLHENDASTQASSFGGEIRSRQQAQLDGAVHRFPKGDPNEALDGKSHLTIRQAIDETITKYGKR